MTDAMTQSLAVCAALFLTLGTIGTIITVPPAQAHTAAAFPTSIELA
ncbi:hypothetical protein [Erythrobacter crassostreae]|uniref:Uncharacterized protein n=1 Tax=Erythrobacter crassostreae TaxID=2828328 RepID=A0A9X1JJX2_9SPHN|nr:hypothetical protein [Erythrobacter crassostrea]MBV7258326.1 hypothetical protein [Erythrobacter crassostrea]